MDEATEGGTGNRGQGKDDGPAADPGGPLSEPDTRLGMAVEAARRLAACRSETDLYTRLLVELGAIAGARGGSLYLVEAGTLKLAAALDPGHAPVSLPARPADRSVLARALASRAPLLTPDLAADGEVDGSGWAGYRDGSFLVIPILDHREQVRGALSLHNRSRPPFTAEDLDLGLILLSLAAEVLGSLRAAEDVRKSEERFRRLVENVSDLICVLDADGTVRYAGPSVEHILGYRPSAVEGRSITEVGDPRQRDQLELLLREVADLPGSHRSVTLRFRHADGTWRILESVAKNALGEPAVRGIVANARDVTAQEEARRREAEQEEQLLQAAKLASLGTLVSGIAHEINNPNNYIRLNADNLRQLWGDVERVVDAVDRESPVALRGIPYADARTMVREMIAGVLEGSYRIERLVGGLRDYARRRETQQMQLVDVNRAVASALTIVEGVVRKATTAFSFAPAASLPPVQGDLLQIEQVVINLVTNACQALPSRDASVQVATRVDDDAREVLVVVIDQGVGIAPGNIERITEPFFTTKRESGGTGLGLSICDRIARNHGGRLEFESVAGRGTCVKFVLPVAELRPPKGDGATTG